MSCCYNKNIVNHSISDFSCLYNGICTLWCLLVLAAHSQEHHPLLLRRSKSTDMFSGVYCYAVLRSKVVFFMQGSSKISWRFFKQLQKVISESFLNNFYLKKLNHPSNCMPEFKLKANVSTTDKAWILHKINTSTDNVLQHKNKPIYSPSTPLRPVSWQNYLPARKELKSSVLFLQLSSRKPISEVPYWAYLGCVLSHFSGPPEPFQLSVTDLHVDWTLLFQSVLLPLTYEGTVLVSLCNPRGLQQMLLEALKRWEHFKLWCNSIHTRSEYSNTTFPTFNSSFQTGSIFSSSL